MCQIKQFEFMRLFVGLGNPGKKYIHTRHNAGSIILQKITESCKFHENKNLKAIYGSIELKDTKIIFLFPLTFMNLSGESVLAALKYFNLNINDTVVFHDEIELPEGSLRYKLGGGHKGHNGLRNIIQKCGGDFHRIRIGVGRPADDRISVADYVLMPSDLSFLPDKNAVERLLENHKLW